MTQDLIGDFLEAFERLGYERTREWAAHAGERIYVHPGSSTATARQFAFLFYKPQNKTFSLQVGVSNPEEMSALYQALPTIARYLHPAIDTTRLARRPCWMRFNAGRALRWQLVSIPDPIAPDSWPLQLNELVSRFLEVEIWPIRDAEGIRKLLLRNDVPFEFGATGSVLRVADIIALTGVVGADWKNTRETILQFRNVIPRDMHGSSKDVEGMLDEFAGALLLR